MGSLNYLCHHIIFANVTKEIGENILNFSIDCARLMKHEFTSLAAHFCTIHDMQK